MPAPVGVSPMQDLTSTQTLEAQVLRWSRSDLIAQKQTSLQMHNDLFINTRYLQRDFFQINLMLHLQFNTNVIRSRLCTFNYYSL